MIVRELCSSVCTMFTRMLRPTAASTVTCHLFVRRSYASAAGPSALVFLEHRGGKINSATLSALTAANGLGGEVTGVLTGGKADGVDEALAAAKK